jgi:hypothetical protein
LDFLSWFSDKGESHEQDGKTLSRAIAALGATASGDPAMAFNPSGISSGAKLHSLRQPRLPHKRGWNRRIRNARKKTAPQNQRRIFSRSINSL